MSRKTTKAIPTDDDKIIYDKYFMTAVGKALDATIEKFKDKLSPGLVEDLRDEFLKTFVAAMKSDVTKEVKLSGEVEFYNNLSSEWKTTVRNVTGLDKTIPRLRIYAKEPDKKQQQQQQTQLPLPPPQQQIPQHFHMQNQQFHTQAQLQGVDIPNYTHKITLKGHASSVSSVRFSPNGDLLASASADGTINIWHGKQGTYVKTLTGHDQGISDIAWSPDSRSLCSGSDDQTVRVWDIESMKTIKKFTGHKGPVFTVNYNAQGTLIVSGSMDESVILWDLRANRVVRRFWAHSDPITSVQFSADGKLLATGSYDGLCRVWSVDTGLCLKTFVDEENPPVSLVKFSPNGKYILTSTLDSTIKLWDYERVKCLRVYQGHQNTNLCLNAAFSITSGHKIVSGSEDGCVYLWDLQKKTIVQRLIGHSAPVFGVDCHPVENIIASGAGAPDNTIFLWFDLPKQNSQHQQQQQQ